MKNLFRLSCILLFLGTLVHAQEAPKFLTKSNLSLLAGDAFSKGFDAYYTHRSSEFSSFQEHDPIARPFVRHTPGQVAFFSAALALDIGTAYLLNKHRHSKLAKFIFIGGMLNNGYGAAYSATQHRD